MKLFKIRCSAIGEIMTEGKNSGGLTETQARDLAELQAKGSKSKRVAELIEKRDRPPELSATAKTHCQNWLREQLYGRKKEINSKYCEKGNSVEDASIRFLNEITFSDYVKNEEYKENDYMTGTCDIKDICSIRDVKNSWDCYTFPLFDNGIKNAMYKWQLQGYMELYDKDIGYLDYLLMDAPLHMIIQEAKNVAYKKNLDYDDIFSEVHRMMTFSDVDNKHKHKEFIVNRDRQEIEKVYERVKMCRKYIADLINTLKN